MTAARLMWLVSLSGVVTVLSACQEHPDITPVPSNAVPERAAGQTTGSGLAYRYPDSPPMVDAAALRAFVGRFRHRVVLLDFWASWSRRSIEEMPRLAEMQGAVAEQDLQIVSCNLDRPEDWTDRTVPTLKRLGATFPCVVIPPDARPAVRAWLAQDWSYDLPARFLLDRRGEVVGRALSGAPLDGLLSQARALAERDTGLASPASLAPGAAAVRVKLVDVKQGLGEGLGEAAVERADARSLARQIAGRVAGRLDRAGNPRIAVLPFTRITDGADDEFGTEIAQRLVEELRARGYHDLLGPRQTRRMMDRIGVTAVTVEFAPASIQGRLPCDYLLLGWLRGTADRRRD